jgi:hypothetical protein
MAVTARESSNGRSPGAAMIASTRAPSAARRTIAFSFSAHSPRSASAACAASMAALASSPAHETTSWRAAAVSAIASEKPALRRQRAGAACRSASGWPCRRRSLHLVDLVPAGLRLLEPVPDDVEVAVEQINPLVLHRQPAAAIHEPPPRPRCPRSRAHARRRPGSPLVSRARAPVAVRMEMDSAARARAAERHCHHTRDLDQPFGELAHGSH